MVIMKLMVFVILVITNVLDVSTNQETVTHVKETEKTNQLVLVHTDIMKI